MYETEIELDDLQTLLDSSLAGASGHLRSIIRPGETSASARELARLLTGMCLLSLATVTAGGEPRISAVDGHFLHGHWFFGTDRSAVKARHLRARPAVSSAHFRGEELGVFTHGVAEELNPAEGPADPQWPDVLEHMTQHYGVSPLTWGDGVYYRLRPHWMVVYAHELDNLLGTAASS